MFYKKTDFPEISELVLCTVKKILYHSVFVDLDEYDNKEGMIHISEIAPGRIRNINDHVRVGKKIVCKILNINREKGYIDLSLRRVSVAARKKKNTEHKQEQKAEKILEILARELKTEMKDIYDNVGKKLLEEYESLYVAFQDIVAREDAIKELDFPKNISNKLLAIVKDRVKLPEVKINSDFLLRSYNHDGIKDIKKALESVAKSNTIEVKYLSAPKYRISITAKDYKSAEKTMASLLENLDKEVKKFNGEFEIVKQQ